MGIGTPNRNSNDEIKRRLDAASGAVEYDQILADLTPEQREAYLIYEDELWIDPETGFTRTIGMGGLGWAEAHEIARAESIPPFPPPRGMSSEVVDSASIWDQQCFLVENMKRLATVGGHQSYDNFGTLDGEPGSIVSTLHRGPIRDRSIDTILNLTPSQYALLVPYIKLYRVLYDKKDQLKVIGEQEIPLQSFTSRDDIEGIFTNQESRQAGAGVKSFTWKLDGVQPEEVDNNITATLEMHFQSIHDLFRHNIDLNADPENASAGRENPGFLDLIIAPESAVHIRGGRPDSAAGNKKCSLDKGNAGLTYEGALYRIKADVGWALPDGMENHPGIPNVEALMDALENQRKTLFLQLARHNITFQQDGVVKLTIEYQAALSGMFRSEWSNILSHPKQLEDIFKTNEQARALREEFHQDGEGMSDANKKEFEEYLNAQIKLEQEDRLRKYRRVLEKVYANDKISRIRVPMSELLKKPWDQLTPAQRSARAKKRQSKDPAERGYELHPTGIGSGAKELLVNMEDGAALTKKEINRIGKGLNSIKKATPKDYVDIHYFYLGDLIDSVLELPQLKKQIYNGNYQIILGTVEYIDPLVAYQIKNITDIANCGGLRDMQKAAIIDQLNPLAKRGEKGIIEHMSMASIPISVDAFNEWFYNKVIKKGLTRYHLDQFIKDILAALVGRALSARCFADVPQVPLRFATNDFFMRGDSVGGSRFGLDTVRERITKRYWIPNLDQSDALRKVQFDPSSLPKPTLFVYSTDSLPAGNHTGKSELDHALGIYHFYLGASAGLVKKINFQREDMPYFREAKIQKVGALGATQLRELYKVKMTMIGNTLLKNGQYIYINPTAIGAGSPSSEQPNIARMLGLGGYFLVTSVSHRVSESGFEVTCEALHQSVPEGREGSVAIVAQAAAAEPAPNQRRRGKSKKKEKDWVAEQQEQDPAEISALQLGLQVLGIPRWLAGTAATMVGFGSPVLSAMTGYGLIRKGLSARRQLMAGSNKEGEIDMSGPWQAYDPATEAPAAGSNEQAVEIDMSGPWQAWDPATGKYVDVE